MCLRVSLSLSVSLSLPPSLSLSHTQNNGDPNTDDAPRELQFRKGFEETEADRRGTGAGRGGKGGGSGGAFSPEHATRLQGVEVGGVRGEAGVGQGAREEATADGGRRLQSQPMRRPKA